MAPESLFLGRILETVHANESGYNVRILEVMVSIG